MQKNKIVLSIVILLVVAGAIWLASMEQKSKGPEEEEQEEVQEIFSLSAVVQSVDTENNVLVVKPAKEEREIRVSIAETTKLIKLEFPFDLANPPADATFTPTQTEIELSDFEVGDNIFIKAKDNIAGKNEFSNVDFIHILP